MGPLVHPPPILVAIVGGLLLGLAHLAPQAWPLAWLGIAATAWALGSEQLAHRDKSAAQAVVGLVVAGILTRCIWLGWSVAMARAMKPGEPVEQLLLAVGFVVVVASPVIVLLVVCALLFHSRPGWVRVWLPICWTVGEQVQARWTSVSTDWLLTQVEVGPVMEALHTLGLVPTTLVCLFAAASVGEGLALDRRSEPLLGGVAIIALLLVPARPVGDSAQLVGLGLVHSPDVDHLPAVDRITPELEVLIWPETSWSVRPPVEEGMVENVRVDAVAGITRASHLVSVDTPPRYGRQNMAIAVAPDGSITQARAKISLLPVFERRFLGIGDVGFIPGQAAPVLDAAGRRFIALICGEILRADLVAAGVDEGGEVLVVMARDRYQGGSALADHLVLSKLRLRAIEFGVPGVYASLGGRASFVSARGEVLARSDVDAPAGVLTWTPDGGGRDVHGDLEPRVTVLVSAQTPQLRPDCALRGCEFRSLEEPDCGEARARTLIVSAHGDGETIAGLTPEQFADRVACFEPELVVLDACFSASAPILLALAARTDALVVAVPAFVAADGLQYRRELFDDELPAAQRAEAVATVPPSPLYVGQPDPEAIAVAQAWVAGADGDTLRPLVRSWVPTLVVVDVGGHELLIPADWRTIGHPPDSSE